MSQFRPHCRVNIYPIGVEVEWRMESCVSLDWTSLPSAWMWRQHLQSNSQLIKRALLTVVRIKWLVSFVYWRCHRLYLRRLQRIALDGEAENSQQLGSLCDAQRLTADGPSAERPLIRSRIERICFDALDPGVFLCAILLTRSRFHSIILVL